MSGSLCSARRSLLTIIMNPLTTMRVMLSVMKTEMGTLINPTMSREYFPRSFCINKVLFYMLNVLHIWKYIGNKLDVNIDYDSVNDPIKFLIFL